METKTVTSKHGRAGHDITVDYKSGILFCLTCKHHVLSDAEAVAGDMLKTLQVVEGALSVIEAHHATLEPSLTLQMVRGVIAAAKGESNNETQNG